jgi:putative nucleotidyltransferase with HDIG domain
MRRVKQVLSAIRAEVTPQDESFIAQRLTQPEIELFQQMSLADRRHCLNVAYTVAELSSGYHGLNLTVLIKAALLHDVGRRRGDVSTIDKIFAVMSRAVFGSGITQKWGKQGRGSALENLRHAFYVSAHHSQLGADLLRLAGTEEQVINLVRYHHHPDSLTDSRELTLLRQADDLN